MARKNKKRRVKGTVVPVGIISGVGLILLLGLGYVWLGCCCQSLGREIKALEIERDELAKLHLNEVYKWNVMKNPHNLKSALDRHGISMTWPRREQIVVLDGSCTELADLSGSGSGINGYAAFRRVARNE